MPRTAYIGSALLVVGLAGCAQNPPVVRGGREPAGFSPARAQLAPTVTVAHDRFRDFTRYDIEWTTLPARPLEVELEAAVLRTSATLLHPDGLPVEKSTAAIHFVAIIPSYFGSRPATYFGLSNRRLIVLADGSRIDFGSDRLETHWHSNPTATAQEDYLTITLPLEALRMIAYSTVAEGQVGAQFEFVFNPEAKRQLRALLERAGVGRSATGT
jgi:hypothetical protein